MLQVGLNPYGIAYSVGLFGADSPRPNPNPLGLKGFLDLADSITAAGVEMPVQLLEGVGAGEADLVRARLHGKSKYAILMHGIPWGDLDGSLTVAKRYGFAMIRLHLTNVLCGARAELGDEWPRIILDARAQLKLFAQKAADQNISVTVENHQDLTADELLEICGECGPNVGICLDTGNSLAVGEEPYPFARKVAPLVRHIHLKDYRMYPCDDGYRLARCPIGFGLVPFKQLIPIFARHGPIPASIEPGALTERHIQLLKDEWWTHYSHRLSPGFKSTLKFHYSPPPERADWRTPWEKGANPEDVVKYEMDELKQSVANLKDLGLMTT